VIRITRAYGRGLGTYKIFIDDVFRGRIKKGETKEFAVENGKHIVCAKIDYRSSGRLPVKVKDSVVELEVGYAEQGWVSKTPENDLIRSILSRHEALFIRVKETIEESE